MTSGRTLLPVFGLWVVWVHMLSLVALQPLSQVSLPPLRPSVRFVDAEQVHVADLEAGPNCLRQIAAELSEPFSHDVEIPVSGLPVAGGADGAQPAQPGVDYTVQRDAVVVFPAGATRGYLRERASLLDVTVTPAPAGGEQRRFRLQLNGTDDVVVAPDPLAFRTIEIPALSVSPTEKGNPARFRESLVDLDEEQLADYRFMVDSKRPATADAELTFTLYRLVEQGKRPVASFNGRFPRGASETSFSLRDLLPESELQRLGVTHDPRPGLDTWYELHLDARPPLISAEDPCLATIFCRDRDGVAGLTFRLEDEQGNSIDRAFQETPFWVVAELSTPIEVDCPVTPLIDDRELPTSGLIPAGQHSSGRMGPFTLPEGIDRTRDDLWVSVRAGLERGGGVCRSCNGRPGGCGLCEGAGEGAGTSTGPVNEPRATSIPLGPAVPGDFMLFLVNNQRLHEPGETIVQQAQAAIHGRNAYKQAVMVINGDGTESLLTSSDGEPAEAQAFHPNGTDGQDMAGQATRIIEAIARRRRNAANADLGALVIWPEREANALSRLDGADLMSDTGSGPVSFLFPDADPARARDLAAALAEKFGSNGRLTVRSPSSEELSEHIADVLDTIGSPGDQEFGGKQGSP